MESFEEEDWKTLEALVLAAQVEPQSGDFEEDSARILFGEQVSGLFDHLKELVEPVSGKKVTEASKEYLQGAPYSKHKTARDAELAIEEFQNFIGDIALSNVTAVHVYDYADSIGKSKGKETIAKKIGYVRRLFDFAVRRGWVTTNVIHGVKLPPNLGSAREKYKPFSTDELEQLFNQKMPEHLRLLLSILVTSGMRLDEAALLNWEDIKEEDGIVFFDLTGRKGTIKNEGSARKVPVHRALLKEITTGKTGQLFPQFKRDKDGKAQSPASKALMRLIRKVTDDRSKVVHSLRGTVKDLMRDSGVSKEINDFITGHGSGDVAGSYGDGPSLTKRSEAIDSVDHTWLV